MLDRPIDITVNLPDGRDRAIQQVNHKENTMHAIISTYGEANTIREDFAGYKNGKALYEDVKGQWLRLHGIGATQQDAEGFSYCYEFPVGSQYTINHRTTGKTTELFVQIKAVVSCVPVSRNLIRAMKSEINQSSKLIDLFDDWILLHLFINIDGELDFRAPPAEKNNDLELTGDMLLRPIGELFELVENRPNRKGLPRMTYRDQYDNFAMRVERTTRGYTVSCLLNGATSYQLNTKYFDHRIPIGVPMLYAANEKFNPFDSAREIAQFFEINA